MPETNYFARVYRIARILLHTLFALAIATFVWPIISKKNRLRLISWWSSSLLKCFNIKIVTHGQLPAINTQATMFVANHISWVDIHAINSVIPLKFIAKSEISSWPIFGYLVRKSGTLFINRSSRKDAGRIVKITTQSLQNSDNVGFFPEGTTTDGSHLVKFKSSILQAAVGANATVWPIAIYYPQIDGSANTQMAYADETTMGDSMLNILKQKEPVVELHFLRPISTHQSERQTITKAAFESIAKQLNF